MCILCIQANPFITRSKDIHISPSQVGYVVSFLKSRLSIFYQCCTQYAISHHIWLFITLQWCHNDGAMMSQITSLIIVYSIVCSMRRSKKTSKLRVTGLCEGNPPVTGEFPAQRVSNAKNVSIWWRHHDETAQIGLISIRTDMTFEHFTRGQMR